MRPEIEVDPALGIDPSQIDRLFPGLTDTAAAAAAAALKNSGLFVGGLGVCMRVLWCGVVWCDVVCLHVGECVWV